MPHRIQRRRTKGFRLPPRTLCISRPSRFGNPYPVALYGREAALKHFEAYLTAMPPTEYQALLHEVRQADYLACWCPLTEACHGDLWIQHAAAATHAEKGPSSGYQKRVPLVQFAE